MEPFEAAKPARLARAAMPWVLEASDRGTRELMWMYVNFSHRPSVTKGIN